MYGNTLCVYVCGAVELWSGEEGNDEHYVAHGFNRLPPRMKGADGVYACARVCLKFKFASQRAAVVVVVGFVVVGVFLLDVCYRSVFGAIWGDTLAPRLPTFICQRILPAIRPKYKELHRERKNTLHCVILLKKVLRLKSCNYSIFIIIFVYR